MQTLKKNKVEFISAEFGICLLSSPSGYNSGNVRLCPHLALGSLFEVISDPQSVAVSFRLGCIWAGPYYSALLAFYQLKSQEWVFQCPAVTQVPPPLASRGGCWSD